MREPAREADGADTPALADQARVRPVVLKQPGPAGRILNWVMWRLSDRRWFGLMRRMPALPRRFVPRLGTWEPAEVDVPPGLGTVAGAFVDPDMQLAAHRAQPLHDWDVVHATGHDWYRRFGWRAFLPVIPRFLRLAEAQQRQGVRPLPGAVRVDDAATLERSVRDKVRELGISAIGVARFDPKHSCVEHKNIQMGDRVIVCVLEQSYEAMLSIPSWDAERAAQDCTAELREKCLALAAHLQSLGYKARANPRWLSVPYAIEAGLGQLGMNGQLLTTVAGSRVRLEVVSTNAPLPFGAPRDFGINKLCDECQICARRCPPGAIPLKRREYRGVLKSKVNAARCFPTVAQAAGCAVCMKVCPVQRFGLQPVLDEYARSGAILGKGTDALEGYDFVDGHHYGPGQSPKLPRGFFNPSGLVFDATRMQPDPDEGPAPPM
jgi:ferredoxin